MINLYAKRITTGIEQKRHFLNFQTIKNNLGMKLSSDIYLNKISV